MSEQKPILYNYYRSSASIRARIALAWKGVDYEYKPVNLLTLANLTEEFERINPTKKVPAFITKHGELITQSEAIIEYLDEVYPERPLLPKNPVQKAYAREISQIIACDIHPLQNLGVLRRAAGDDMEKRAQWAKESIETGLKGLEQRLKAVCGKYSVGDEVTIADIFLNSIVSNANRWGVDVAQFPTISRINESLTTLPEFIAAAPNNQPDFPKQQ